jgi:MFS family permease
VGDDRQRARFGQVSLSDLAEPPDGPAQPGSASLARRGVTLVLGEDIGSDFAKLWSASAISGVGDGIVLTAAPLLALSLTSDPRLIAGVTTALTLPYLLFSLPAGVITDRVNGRRAMAAVDGFRAVLLGGFTVLVATHRVDLLALYACLFIIGTCDSFFRNTSQTIVPQVVHPDALVVANSRMMAAEIVMNEFLGPMTGGFLFAAAAVLPFGIDAASFAASSTLLTRLRTRTELQPAAPVAAAPPRRPPLPSRLRGLLVDLAAGLRVLWRHRLLRSLAVIAGLNNFVSYAILAVLVVFAHYDLHLSKAGYGLLLGAAAAGGVIASRLGPRIARALGRERTLLVAMTAQAGSYVVIFTTSQPLLTAAMLAVAAGATILWNVVVVVLRQTLVPSEVLGRVTSIYRLIAWGALPVGSFCGGLLAAAFGPRSVFALAALVLAGVVAYVIRMVARHAISGPVTQTPEAANEPQTVNDDGEVLP